MRTLYITSLLFVYAVVNVGMIRLAANDVHERIYMQTDRSVYLAGEKIRFQVFSLSPGTGKIYSASTIAYVELLNEERIPVLQAKVALEEGRGNGGMMLPADLPSGQYTLCVYSKWMKHFNEDHFFTRSITVINTFQPADQYPIPLRSDSPGEWPLTIAASFDREIYKKREKVDVSISVTTSDTAAGAVVSVAVYRLDSWQQPDLQDIRSLSRQSNINRSEPVRVQYPPELNGEILTGTVVDRLNGTLVPLAPLYLSFPGSMPAFYYTVSDSSGRFAVEIPEAVKSKSLVVQVPGHETASLKFDDPFYSHQHFTPRKDYAAAGMDSAAGKDLNQRHLELQLQMAFSPRERAPSLPADSNALQFFGTPDEVVYLDDFTRFTTIEEVFREYIPTVMVRRHEDGLHLRVLNNGVAIPKFFDSDPLVLIDGVPIFDNNKLFGYDPLKVRKISVLARYFFYGRLEARGVVSLQTYHGDLDGFPLDSNATVVDYQPVMHAPRFFSPQYEDADSAASRIPDFRNLLYWAPSVVTDLQGKAGISFYTGDVPGQYAIVIKGISKAGEAGASVSKFYIE